MKHTQGKVDANKNSWIGQTYYAGEDIEGERNAYDASASVHHEDENTDFSITVRLDDETQELAGDKAVACVNHIAALWNAANGMPTAEAVKYIEHGREALEVLKSHCKCCALGFEMSDQVAPCNEPDGTCANKNIVTKLEAK